MDDIIECVVELIFDIFSELAEGQETPRWLRIVSRIIVTLIEIALGVVLVMLGIQLLEKNRPVGIAFLVGLAVVAVIVAVLLRRMRRRRKEKEQLHPLEQKWSEDD